MRSIDFNPPSAVAQVAPALWAHWTQADEPPRAPAPSAGKRAVAQLFAWCVKPETGHAYALAATQCYCHLRGLDTPPPSSWEWLPCDREVSRCARLRNGNLRVATPEPINIVGVMLMVHELCHASLEWQSPGSLADTERTETFAMAGELFAQQWLLSPECPEHRSLSLARVIASWTQEREHEFGTRHAALARFEWLLWSAAQSPPTPEHLQTHIEAAWQRSHAEFGLVATPDAWARHPLITRKPGSAGIYPTAWRAANSEVLHAA
jgi:hypothetical protein